MLCTVAEVQQEMEERPKTIIIYLKIKLDIKAETINLPDPEKSSSQQTKFNSLNCSGGRREKSTLQLIFLVYHENRKF
jgi:hypothetical protein